MTLTLTYDSVLSRVRVAATGLSTDGSTIAFIQRTTDLVNWTNMRGGYGKPVAAGAVDVDDYEFPSGVLATYQVLQSASGPLGWNQLSVNQASLEAGTTGWVARANTTIAQSAAQAAHGTKSLSLTSVGAGTAGAETTKVPASAGNTYTAVGSFRTAVTTRSCRVTIEWYDAADVSLGTTIGISITDATGSWTQASVTGTAPANTAKAKIIVEVLATIAAEVHYVDKVGLVGGTSTVWVLPPEQASITATLTAPWLKSIARPFLNRQLSVVDFSDVTRAERNGVFAVVGRSYPVAVTDLRGPRQYTLEVLTETLALAAEFDLILAAGDPVFVHVPAGSAVPTGYWVIGDMAETRAGRLSPRRVFSLPLTETAVPGPDVVGAAATYQTVLNTYANYQALLSAHASYASVLTLIGSPSEVIVP